MLYIKYNINFNKIIYKLFLINLFFCIKFIKNDFIIFFVIDMVKFIIYLMIIKFKFNYLIY